MVTVSTTHPSAAAPLLRTRQPHEYHCAGCAYGIVVRALPTSCPMCRGTVWELTKTNPTIADDAFTATY